MDLQPEIMHPHAIMYSLARSIKQKKFKKCFRILHSRHERTHLENKNNIDLPFLVIFEDGQFTRRKTLLDLAIRKGTADIVKLLIDFGSTINLEKVLSPLFKQKNRLVLDLEILNLLLTKNANPNALVHTILRSVYLNYTQKLSILESIMKFVKNSDPLNCLMFHTRPLHFLVIAHPEHDIEFKKGIIKLLVDHGANPNLTIGDGNSVVNLVRHDCLYEFFKEIYPDFNLLNTNRYGNNALHHAVEYRHVEGIKFLCRMEPKLLFMRNSNGDTPVDHSFCFGTFEICKILLGFLPLDHPFEKFISLADGRLFYSRHYKHSDSVLVQSEKILKLASSYRVLPLFSLFLAENENTL